MDGGCVSQSEKTNLPLCVDLDGTLIPVDTLHESVIQAGRQHPLATALAIATFFFGHRSRSRLKSEICRIHQFDASVVPLRAEVMQYVEHARSAGRDVYLVTAAHQSIADAFAGRLGIFSEAFGSKETLNLKGAAKAKLLVERFGDGGFEYIGDSLADLDVWASAGAGTVVAGGGQLNSTLDGHELKVISVQAPKKLDFVRAMRPRQWVKNLLLFLPVLTSHQIFSAHVLLSATAGFVLMSLMASAVYLLNDVLDAQDDRLHPDKRRRPIALGLVPISTALVGSLTLAALALLTAFLVLPIGYFWLLVLYGVLTLAYTMAIKRLPVLDVAVLAGLYVLRIEMGGVVTGIGVSNWLLGFAAFGFGSLALLKRYTELATAVRDGRGAIAGRGYSAEFVGLISGVGIAFAVAAVVLIPFYAFSEQARLLYAKPTLLLLAIGPVGIWFWRAWWLAHRGLMPSDPIEFAIRDRIGWALALVLGVGVCLAIR